MAKGNQVSIPYLDPNVQHVGISRLRSLNVTQLRDLDKTLVIQDVDEPLAVLLKYEQFIAMQQRMDKVVQSQFQDAVAREIKAQAHGKCQCKRTTCGHKGQCGNELVDGDFRPRQKKADASDFTVANGEALCRKCFNQAEHDAKS